MKLAPELRLNIYDALLETSPKSVGLRMWAEGTLCASITESHRGTGDDAVALMKCCTQVHSEMALVLRKRLSFTVLLFSEPQPAHNFLDFKEVSDAVLRVPIKSVSISICIQGKAGCEAATPNIRALAAVLVSPKNLTITKLDASDTNISRSALENPVVATACKAFKAFRVADNLMFRCWGTESEVLGSGTPVLRQGGGFQVGGAGGEVGLMTEGTDAGRKF
ncbi:hypothetical protein LTR78_004671 [Recurvomyces mirabilis]|uniref:Uncharacterized protein n=1 Tax=Recurvomyces mirabilis TaxID=574656 RepID=A0AAE0WPR1_9PEZI|nr:hypothetical protein LTR78_004671 [Recurvomyces mirabilis]KAK5152836.1 hypothetical protein LTS14_007943 [Recurvomyces mirabilis]